MMIKLDLEIVGRKMEEDEGKTSRWERLDAEGEETTCIIEGFLFLV